MTKQRLKLKRRSKKRLKQLMMQLSKKLKLMLQRRLQIRSRLRKMLPVVPSQQQVERLLPLHLVLRLLQLLLPPQLLLLNE